MAQKVTVLLVDDLNGGEAHETLTFGLDGKSYEIDLSDSNAEELRNFLEAYVKAGRKVSGGPGRKPSTAATRTPSSNSGPDAGTVREWAKENGYEVSDRGRVPAPVREAYEKAHA
ncbi:Lsr2 family protein [Streptomyces sp. NPDC051445]|uniref:Lsr2 family protein n=1 Tax=Streptomyces sp. NPDC051445 TaxID=3365653 RepID=UPI00379F2004